MRPQLTVNDLVAGLAGAPSAYHALHVFADDLAGGLVDGLRQEGEGPRYRLDRTGGSYSLEVLELEGILRLSRPAPSLGDQQATPIMALDHALVVARDAASRRKGEGAVFCGLLGLLVGGVLGDGPDAPRRVFTLMFNPNTLLWEVYCGGLVRWMKRELLPVR